LPTLWEQVRDFFVSLDFVRDRRRTLSVVFEVYHLVTLGCALAFVLRYATPLGATVLVVLLLAFANVWNTVWYHRYCSHRAFSFRSLWTARALLWLNPIGFREEIYALLHYPHHLYTDSADDPYGPHLGRLGSYVASGRFRIDTKLTEGEYDRLKRLISHVPIVCSSLATFKRWGSVEHPIHYLGRLLFANAVWGGISYVIAGPSGVMVWYTTVFLFTFLMRDFNYRGHGGGRVRHRDAWDFSRDTLALNQWFYGLIASEWHNNHHMFPRSAKNGFLAGQIDVAFGMVVGLRWLGVVDSVNDHTSMFRERIARSDEVMSYAAERRASQ